MVTLANGKRGSRATPGRDEEEGISERFQDEPDAEHAETKQRKKSLKKKTVHTTPHKHPTNEKKKTAAPDGGSTLQSRMGLTYVVGSSPEIALPSTDSPEPSTTSSSKHSVHKKKKKIESSEEASSLKSRMGLTYAIGSSSETTLPASDSSDTTHAPKTTKPETNAKKSRTKTERERFVDEPEPEDEAQEKSELLSSSSEDIAVLCSKEFFCVLLFIAMLAVALVILHLKGWIPEIDPSKSGSGSDTEEDNTYNDYESAETELRPRGGHPDLFGD